MKTEEALRKETRANDLALKYSCWQMSQNSQESTYQCAPPFLMGGGGEPPTKFSKGGGLKGPQFLKGEFLGKRGVTFFRGSAIFR